MAALTSASLGFLFSCSWILAVNADTKNITVKLGGECILPCEGRTGASIEGFWWKRCDLKSDHYVFICRDNCPEEKYQLQDYHGRVELMDPEWKKKNTSVILKNVTVNDTGTYECVVLVSSSSSRRRKRNTRELTRFINLKVEGQTAGQTEGRGDLQGHYGLVALFVVVSVIVIGSLTLIAYKKHVKKSPEHPEADEDAEKKKLSAEPIPQ